MKEATKLGYTIAEYAAAIGLGRTKVYEEIRAGRLRTVKVGRRTIITHTAAEEHVGLLDREAGQTEAA